jgi:hypothetical protein
VTGKSKAAMLKRVAEDRAAEVADLPIKGVDPTSGELRWYLDGEACGA